MGTHVFFFFRPLDIPNIILKHSSVQEPIDKATTVEKEANKEGKDGFDKGNWLVVSKYFLFSPLPGEMIKSKPSTNPLKKGYKTSKKSLGHCIAHHYTPVN